MIDCTSCGKTIEKETEVFLPEYEVYAPVYVCQCGAEYMDSLQFEVTVERIKQKKSA